MIDIWGRPLTALEKPTTGIQTADDVKKIIEDEIDETLNLSSVDPNEIVVFQDRQGKLKSSNASADDILVRQRNAAENSIALYSSDERLKPDALVPTITDQIATHGQMMNNDVVKFFGTPAVTSPTLTEIKALLDKQKKPQ